MTPLASPRAPLAIVAGGGDLPRRVMQACVDQNRLFLIVGLEDQADPADWPPDIPQIWVKLSRAFGVLEDIRKRGFTSICLAGHVRRPSLSGLLKLWPDKRSAAFLMKAAKQALGDDSLLRALVNELEAEGFAIEAPHGVIGPSLPQEGVLGAVQPDEQGWRDLRFAFKIAKMLGSLDVGQGAVVQEGIPLALEAIEGTDAMLERAGKLARNGPGGVLVKALKPGQDTRVDMPAVGVRTIENAHKAGLRGVGVEAGATLLIDPERIICKADQLGLFFVGLAGEDSGP